MLYQIGVLFLIGIPVVIYQMIVYLRISSRSQKKLDEMLSQKIPSKPSIERSKAIREVKAAETMLTTLRMNIILSGGAVLIITFISVIYVMLGKSFYEPFRYEEEDGTRRSELWIYKYLFWMCIGCCSFYFIILQRSFEDFFKGHKITEK